jgi:hypothetical protein
MLTKIELLHSKIQIPMLKHRITKEFDIQMNKVMRLKMLLLDKGNREGIRRFNKNVSNKIYNMHPYLPS